MNVRDDSGKISLAEYLANGIFEIPINNGLYRMQVQRIQFLGGKYPNKEVPAGGLCKKALVDNIERLLKSYEEIEK